MFFSSLSNCQLAYSLINRFSVVFVVLCFPAIRYYLIGNCCVGSGCINSPGPLIQHWLSKPCGRHTISLDNQRLQINEGVCAITVTFTSCGVMFAAYPCPPGTLFHSFVPRNLPIFSFIINKFIISNFILHNPAHKLTCKCGFLGEVTCPTDMDGRRTSLHNQYCYSV